MSAACPLTQAIPARRADDIFPPLPVKRSPEYIQAELRRMRTTLILAEHRALERRFTGGPLTDFGALP